MEDPDANLPLSPSSPNPPSPGNNENDIEAPRICPLMNATSLSPSSSNLSSLANNENKNKSVQIRFIRSVKSPSSSSPNPSPQGNDENESEENRDSVQMGAKSEHQSEQSSPKNFMSPTISTASKCFPYKKKILSEWTDTSPDTHLKKPSNLCPKSEMGTSSSTPTKSLFKIPFAGSPNSASKSDDVIVEDETFIPDPSTKPYDPLTNYLSPRPKFLRYNPNRRRKSILLTQSEQGCSPSPGVSHTSSAYSTAESSMRPDLGGKGQSEKQEEEEVAKDQEEEEEEMMGVGLRKCGLKWGLFKSLIVLIVLVLSTMYISSMNKPEPASDMRGLKVEYQEFGNSTFRSVSLRTIEFGSWVLDMREESEMGMLKIDEIFVGGGGRSLVKTYEMDDDIEDQELEEVAEKTDSLEDYSRNLTPFGTEDGTSPILENLEDAQAEIEVPLIAQAPNQTIEDENLVFDAKLIDGEVENKAEILASDDIEVTEEEILAESNSKDKQLTNEAEFVAESPDLDFKEENVADYKVEVVEFKPKSEEEELEDEADIVSEYFKRIKEENLPDCDELIAESERKSDRSETVTKNPIKEALEGNTFESGQKQFRLNPKNALWLVIPSVMTWVAALVVRFYLKCKKASSKTTSSNAKLSTQMKRNSSRLPPKAGGKTTQIQKTDPKLNPPSVDLSIREKLGKASSRIIPRVEMLGEFVVGGEFRRSKIREIEESIHSFPEAPKVTYSSPAPTRSHLYTSESSEAESSPHGSFVSHDKTAEWQDGKEEVNKMIPTPLRRSSRLRNKAVTSP
ncbi:hypothetical protein Cgig2_023445 [Carnegiea gigantea]|uniref:Uncharacterized protein n=1 Tax=Carnegiea gigantea TaxID=171969 RepID=A0A9Q1JKP0_9CARY|nr:hypothetical protein Cgig2_023445 [Carnegiea gigantea]